MLVACRLAGLSALAAYYAAVRAYVQFGPTQSPNAARPELRASRAPGERRACDISSAARIHGPGELRACAGDRSGIAAVRRRRSGQRQRAAWRERAEDWHR